MAYDDEVLPLVELVPLSTPPASLGVSDLALADLQMRVEALDTPIDSDDDPKVRYALVRSMIGGLRSLRGRIETRREDAKRPAIAFGRELDAEAKRLTEVVAGLEERLKKRKKVVDDREAKEKADREAAEKLRFETLARRVGLIEALGDAAAKIAMSGVEPEEREARLLKLRDLAAACAAFTIDDSFAEFKARAIETRDATFLRIQECGVAYTARVGEAEKIEAAREANERERHRIEEEKRANAKAAAAIAAEREELERERRTLEESKRPYVAEPPKPEAPKPSEPPAEAPPLTHVSEPVRSTVERLRKPVAADKCQALVDDIADVILYVESEAIDPTKRSMRSLTDNEKAGGYDSIFALFMKYIQEKA